MSDNVDIPVLVADWVDTLIDRSFETFWKTKILKKKSFLSLHK